ncbi:MAG: right-handed parallel beta-helix repeat-containing protein [Verrucomicrobia bacterium]|jgi:parallel beta-helix repeat protein|nr:right-handed parallel beta-helix repeat-containing protein [Verrucomicrobiota bacterium]|tara:strand:+ start:70051 stop:72054 length:2004 start_codon:yes stop_codon:yes gene_type:complete
MTLTEARKILGLGPDEDPRPHLEEFRAVREKIADMVRCAPNEMLEQRYQEGLVEFDRALAAVREYLEALGLIPREADVEVPDTASAGRGHPVFVAENLLANPVGLPVLSQDVPEIEVEPDSEPRASNLFGILCGVLLLLTVVGFGTVAYVKYEEDRELGKIQRVAFLERQGAIFIENRRWPEAAEAFDEIEGIFPDSKLVGIGRRSIEAGMTEEQNQFIGYWKGEALASFENGRLADAESAARQVLDKYPNEKELKQLIAKIDVAKEEEERQEAFDAVRKQVEDRKFDEAISSVSDLVQRNEGHDGHEEALTLLKAAEDAKLKAEVDLEKAQGLLAQAAERDTGEYDEQAMEWLREAVSLAPDNKEILAKFEKMADYTRTIRIPEDVKTVAEALASARDRDRLVLAEGIWEGPFVITAAVELQGVSGKTLIQCEADVGSVISIAPGVNGARLSGLTLRHLSFNACEERFSLAHVRGANVDFSDCRFERGSGHGIAVTDGGHAKVVRCRFTENGWNGIAVMGSGSLLEAEENTLNENFQNGIESWDGAAVILSKNTCTGNSRNGIHVDNGSASASILDNVLSENREFGLVLGSAGSGEVGTNTLERNVLGGLVVRSGASKVVVKENRIADNQGAGLILEVGVAEEPYVGNTISGNAGKEFVSGVDLSP